jgi:hypothetical protein
MVRWRTEEEAKTAGVTDAAPKPGAKATVSDTTRARKTRARSRGLRKHVGYFGAGAGTVAGN